jgi:ribose/xylose/arabinose/galactoside ABC-type transport system permease subunit
MSAPATAAEPGLAARLLAARELPTVVAIALFALIIAVGNPSFLSSYNMQLLAKEVGVLGIMAIGEMVVIILGGIDLSAGSVVALTSVLAGLGLQHGLPIGLVVVGVLAACVVIGAVHSFFICKIGLAPFIITLGSLSIWRGVALVLTKGYPIKINSATFLLIGQGDLLGVPLQFVLLVVLAVIGAAMLLTTPLGRYLYTIGNNATATRLSGVRVTRVITFAYILASVLFGLGGLIYAARLGQGMPGIGKGIELSVIAAAVIGGASITGGSGTVWGTVLGALLLCLIMNALNMLKISYFWQELVMGLAIVLAVLFDLLNRRRKGIR